MNLVSVNDSSKIGFVCAGHCFIVIQLFFVCVFNQLGYNLWKSAAKQIQKAKTKQNKTTHKLKM